MKNNLNSYPSTMSQSQYNSYLQNYMQQHSATSFSQPGPAQPAPPYQYAYQYQPYQAQPIPPPYIQPSAPSQYATYEYLVSQGVVPKVQPPPPGRLAAASDYNRYGRAGMNTGGTASTNRADKPSMRNPELDSPEEISKWLEQRRKNFPTRAKVESKKNVEKVREERGALKRSELSKLELKLRQKIKFLEGDFGDKKKMRKNQKKKNIRNDDKKTKGAKTMKDEKKISAVAAVAAVPSGEKEEIEEGEIVVPVTTKVTEQQSQQSQQEPRQDRNKGRAMADEKNKSRPHPQQPKGGNFNRFKYIKNNLFNSLTRKEEHMEHSVLLQIFRHFVKENIIV